MFIYISYEFTLVPLSPFIYSYIYSYSYPSDITVQILIFIKLISSTGKYEINISLLESVVESLENAASVEEERNEEADDDEDNEMDQVMKHGPETQIEIPSQGYKKSSKSQHIEQLPDNYPNFLASKITNKLALLSSSVERPQEQKVSCNIETTNRYHKVQIWSIETTTDHTSCSENHTQPQHHI